MGGCDRGNFRGYLDNLQQASAEQKKQAFNYIKTGNTKDILKLLNKCPGLLKQASDEDHKSNLIIAMLYEIKYTKHNSIRDPLIKLLNTIIKHHKDKLDLTFIDKDGNTALHRVFWYAITTENTATSKALTEIGLEFINLIKDGTHFRQILALKNIHNQSFLQNIYLNTEKSKLSETQLKHLETITNLVGPLLNPYKKTDANKNSVDQVINFKAKGFRERLEELLTDQITCVLMKNPFTFTKEGHTYDKTTWSSVNPKVNPPTRTPFTDNELKPNKSLKKILGLFNTIDDEAELVEKLTKFFGPEKAATINDLFVSNHDLLTLEIKNLVKGYNNQFCVEIIPEKEKYQNNFEESDSLLPKMHKAQDLIDILVDLKYNILQKKEGRETWFDDNTDTKVGKLETIHLWLIKNPLTIENKPIICALIRDVCAIKRNSWGLFQPHSLAEFNSYAEKLGLFVPNNISFNPSQLQQLLSGNLGGINFITESIEQQPEAFQI
jgi:hypothetical protein